ncbi:MAG: hypothetical protein WHT84_11490 [Breznakiellaceae bacterium]
MILNKSPFDLTDEEKEYYKNVILPSRNLIKQALAEILGQSERVRSEWAAQLPVYSHSIIGQLVSEVMAESRGMIGLDQRKIQQQADIKRQLGLEKMLRAEKLASWGGCLSVLGLFILPVILPLIGIVLGMESRRCAKEAAELGIKLTRDAERGWRNAIIAGVVCLFLPIIILILIAIIT